MPHHCVLLLCGCCWHREFCTGLTFQRHCRFYSLPDTLSSTWSQVEVSPFTTGFLWLPGHPCLLYHRAAVVLRGLLRCLTVSANAGCVLMIVWHRPSGCKHRLEWLTRFLTGGLWVPANSTADGPCPGPLASRVLHVWSPELSTTSPGWSLSLRTGRLVSESGH